MDRINGIYSIMNPVGEIYIGQSWDIKKRWSAHKSDSKHCIKLKESLLKYGHLNHKFEICHLLPKDTTQEVMNSYEQLYMDFYKAAGFCLLNLRNGGSRGKHSEESKLKMSVFQKGKVISDESKLKMSKAKEGMKLTPEAIERLRLCNLGKIVSAETIQKRIEKTTGLKRTQESKIKMSLAQKGKPWSIARREAQNNRVYGIC